MHQENFKPFLDHLIQEFRLWQELHRLSRLERRALIESDALRLNGLVAQKGDLLNDLTSRQHARQALIESNDPARHISIQSLLENLDPAEARCLLNITNGIIGLAGQIGDLAQANYALADCAVRRLWMLQSWIQQEEQHSLPALLVSVLTAQEAIGPRRPSEPLTSQPQPIWSQPLDFVDRDNFSAVFSAGIENLNHLEDF